MLNVHHTASECEGREKKTLKKIIKINIVGDARWFSIMSEKKSSSSRNTTDLCVDNHEKNIFLFVCRN